MSNSLPSKLLLCHSFLRALKDRLNALPVLFTGIRQAGKAEPGRLVWERSICYSRVFGFPCSNLSFPAWLLLSHNHYLLKVTTCCKVPIVKKERKVPYVKKEMPLLVKPISSRICPAFCNSSSEIKLRRGWEGSYFKQVAPRIHYPFFFFSPLWWDVTHHKYCALTFEQLTTQTLMSPPTPFCCWQGGSAPRNCPKGLIDCLFLSDHCQPLFPPAVYGVRERIPSQRVKPVKRRFHM